MKHAVTHPCPYCSDQFVAEDHLDLHRGIEHPNQLSPAEQEAFKSAYEAEQRALRVFRLKALLTLLILYFGLLMMFSIFA